MNHLSYMLNYWKCQKWTILFKWQYDNDNFTQKNHFKKQRSSFPLSKGRTMKVIEICSLGITILTILLSFKMCRNEANNLQLFPEATSIFQKDIFLICLSWFRDRKWEILWLTFETLSMAMKYIKLYFRV